MYNKNKRTDWSLVLNDMKIILMIAAFWALFLSAVVGIPAYFEAQAFNRLTTGPKVTTWDALFLDLRVEASKPCQ